jgi:hypothetical protein
LISPIEFMQRLAALVPRLRLHLIRSHGVPAPNARLRARVMQHGSEVAEQTRPPKPPLPAITRLRPPRRGPVASAGQGCSSVCSTSTWNTARTAAAGSSGSSHRSRSGRRSRRSSLTCGWIRSRRPWAGRTRRCTCCRSRGRRRKHIATACNAKLQPGRQCAPCPYNMPHRYGRCSRWCIAWSRAICWGRPGSRPTKATAAPSR